MISDGSLAFRLGLLDKAYVTQHIRLAQSVTHWLADVERPSNAPLSLLYIGTEVIEVPALTLHNSMR